MLLVIVLNVALCAVVGVGTLSMCGWGVGTDRGSAARLVRTPRPVRFHAQATSSTPEHIRASSPHLVPAPAATAVPVPVG